MIFRGRGWVLDCALTEVNPARFFIIGGCCLIWQSKVLTCLHLQVSITISYYKYVIIYYLFLSFYCFFQSFFSSMIALLSSSLHFVAGMAPVSFLYSLRKSAFSLVMNILIRSKSDLLLSLRLSLIVFLSILIVLESFLFKLLSIPSIPL